MKLLSRISSFLLLLLLTSPLLGQSISGHVYDTDGQPIPFAAVSVKYEERGTTCTNDGVYNLSFNQPNQYTIVVTAVGFKNKSLEIILKNNEDRVLDFYLETDAIQLEAVSVVANKKDPAYGIIASAIKAKRQWRNQLDAFTCSMYIRAKEIISEKEKRRREKIKNQAKLQEKNSSTNEEADDPLEEKKKAQEEAINKLANSMNMAEIRLSRHFKAPNLYKDIREGYKKYGDQEGLYYIQANEDDFDFYTNLMDLYGLNEVPLVSPLHAASILTYKFKLISSEVVDDKLEYKIKVTPRKKGNASWRGYIWIQEGSFAIVKVDLGISKSGLLFYDDFNVKQEYKFHNDSLLLLTRQEFDYKAKAGSKKFVGKTIATFSDYIINPIFEKRFFKNELMVTTQDAYEKDSLYWQGNRGQKLTLEEQRFQFVKDSIYAITHSDHYKDSIELADNEIKLLDILWQGITFSDWRKKRRYFFGSALSMVNPVAPGGMRLGYNGAYFKKWESEKIFSLNGRIDYGLRNENIQGLFSTSYKYDPMHFGYIGAHIGRFYNLIAQNDAVTNLLQRANWMEQDYIGIYWKRELFNGFDLTWRWRYETFRSISNLQFGELTNDWFENNDPIAFDTYHSFNSSINISYTPFRKFITEPRKKVILGSKWPTFSLYYKKGFKDIVNSNVDFDYLELEVKQDIRISTIGTSTYKIQGGQFLNTKKLNYVDYKFFPIGDKYFFASLLESMQLQDTTIITAEEYLKVNYVHHFNGALINYLPLIKKTRLHVVLGAGSLIIPQSDYQYLEAFVGIERTVRIQRSRYRFGLFFVGAQSNLGDITPRLKFAIQRYDARNKNWEY